MGHVRSYIIIEKLGNVHCTKNQISYHTNGIGNAVINFLSIENVKEMYSNKSPRIENVKESYVASTCFLLYKLIAIYVANVV